MQVEVQDALGTQFSKPTIINFLRVNIHVILIRNESGSV